MPLDDRAADEQSDPHAAVLGGVESIEQQIRALWRQAYADIADAQTDAIPAVAFASDEQMSWSIVHVHHRVRAIAEQVQDDLLELDAVAGDERQTLSELGMEGRRGEPSPPCSIVSVPRESFPCIRGSDD